MSFPQPAFEGRPPISPVARAFWEPRIHRLLGVEAPEKSIRHEAPGVAVAGRLLSGLSWQNLKNRDVQRQGTRAVGPIPRAPLQANYGTIFRGRQFALPTLHALLETGLRVQMWLVYQDRTLRARRGPANHCM